jgi:hypothetical protein
MVKNESKIIQRCIDSCKSICDAFVFLDTGSTDNTVEILNTFLQNNVGKVYQEPFVNFGVSRSRSFEVAVDFIKSLEWDLETTFGLLLDADMVLKMNVPIKDKLKGTGYTIVQSNFSLEYDNIRLIKLSKPWKCTGVTHEYWECDGDGERIKIPKEIMYIDDVNDGGCKSDKFERDVRLLEKGLEEEPQNKVRYTFYLAQSYESIDKEKSIEYYKKRVQLGGWFEEVYIALIRIGDMMSNEAEKIYYYLEAYNKDPVRAEALYRLARHYRIVGKQCLSVMFIDIGKKLPYPKNRSLFIEKDVYDFKLDEEMSICGFYVDKFKDQGMDACEKLILSKQIPDHLRGSAFNNQYFYVDKLSYTPLKEVVLEDDVFKCSSACLSQSGNKLIGIQRMVNYSINPENGSYSMRNVHNHVVTSNKLYEINENMEINVLDTITIDTPKKRVSHIKGLEDMRIFTYKDNVYAFATTFEYGDNNHPSQVLCKFNRNVITSIVPLSYKKEHVQKNWCPFIMKDKICCIYSFEPLRILEIDENTGECKEIINKYMDKNLDKLRGSTSPVYNSETNEYTLITHEIHFKHIRNYFHRFLVFDEEWNLKRISRPFYMENKQIEYILGYQVLNNKHIVHYSVMDNCSKFVTLETLPFN